MFVHNVIAHPVAYVAGLIYGEGAFIYIHNSTLPECGDIDGLGDKED